MLYLNVPFEEKDLAKKIGAKWEPHKKKWYVENLKDYYKFANWIYGSIIAIDTLYLVEGISKCWKCHNKTKIIAVGVEKYIELGYEEVEFVDGDIHILCGLESLPIQIVEYIKANYNVKARYSKTINRKYLSNGCDVCDALQGDWFLFHENDSPYFIDSIDSAQALKLYEIKLPYDIALSSRIIYSLTDDLIKQYASLTKIKIDF